MMGSVRQAAPLRCRRSAILAVRNQPRAGASALREAHGRRGAGSAAGCAQTGSGRTSRLFELRSDVCPRPISRVPHEHSPGRWASGAAAHSGTREPGGLGCLHAGGRFYRRRSALSGPAMAHSQASFRPLHPGGAARARGALGTQARRVATLNLDSGIDRRPEPSGSACRMFARLRANYAYASLGQPAPEEPLARRWGLMPAPEYAEALRRAAPRGAGFWNGRARFVGS